MASVRGIYLLVSALALSACVANEPRRPDVPTPGIGLLGSIAPFLTSGVPARGDARAITTAAQHAPPVVGYTDFGSPKAETGEAEVGTPRVTLAAGGASFTLNFVNVELQEFVRVVFDEVLKENVVVDPNLTGRVTVRTQEPVPKATALDLVREALQVSGASLNRTGQVWRVTAGGASGVPGAGGSRARETVRIVPLRFINAADARQALQSFSGNGGADVAAVNNSRLLVLAGRSADVDIMEQVLLSLDVDEMKGQSLALIPLKVASAASVSRDLTQMFGGNEASKNFRALPIERMNAVMVIGRTPSVVARAKDWVAKLDQAGHDQRRVYVYPVRNRRAAEVAKVLDGMLGGRTKVDAGQEAPVAPNLTAQRSVVQASDAQANALAGGETSDALTGARSGQSAGTDQAAVEVRADTSTNTLVIVAKPEDYRIIEAAIRSLDVLPTQVLIEATIAEVRLNDALRHGVRWYLQTGKHGFTLTDSETGGVGNVFPGFNYAFGIPSAKLVLNALESVTEVEIVSSPALTVLDNQVATLKVGDQVPIATRSARSVTNPDAPIVNDIQLKDTGVILSVTPRVNSSGLVMLEITQEASDVVPTTTSNIDSPTIRQRQITSTVAVESGAEIVLGGIISRRQETGRSGIPVLKDIPLVGEAFTSNRRVEYGRSELLVILRPTVMANRAEIRAVTEEIKSRMIGASGSIYQVR